MCNTHHSLCTAPLRLRSSTRKVYNLVISQLTTKTHATKSRFGLRRSHKHENGFSHTHLNLRSRSMVVSSDSSDLSIPNDPGWDVSGNNANIPRKTNSPTKKRPNWTFRHEEYLAGSDYNPAVTTRIITYLPSLQIWSGS
jgi:hypothetical protein